MLKVVKPPVLRSHTQKQGSLCQAQTTLLLLSMTSLNTSDVATHISARSQQRTRSHLPLSANKQVRTLHEPTRHLPHTLHPLCRRCGKLSTLYHMVWECHNNLDLHLKLSPTNEQWEGEVASSSPNSQLWLDINGEYSVQNK